MTIRVTKSLWVMQGSAQVISAWYRDTIITNLFGLGICPWVVSHCMLIVSDAHHRITVFSSLDVSAPTQSAVSL